MLSVKQGDIKYPFKSPWYDTTLDWTLVSRIIGEHYTHLANESGTLLVKPLKKQKLK